MSLEIKYKNNSLKKLSFLQEIIGGDYSGCCFSFPEVQELMSFENDKWQFNVR